MLKKMMAVLLAVMLCAASAAAEDAKPAFALGTGALESPAAETAEGKTNYRPQSYVYLGAANDSPIRWRVLDAEKASDGVTGGVFLLSEYTLEDGVLFHPTDGKYKASGNVWQGSTAQSWCSQFVNNAMNGVEQAALLGVNKTEPAGKVAGIMWKESVLTDSDLAFFLSVQELLAYLADYERAPSRKAENSTGTGKHWWLRSGSSLYNYTAGALESTGTLTHVDVDMSIISARPAVNLKPTNVLMTSAVDAKNSGANGFADVQDVTATDWELTLLDSKRVFAVADTAVSCEPGETFTLHYTDAKTGANERISALLMKDGEIIAYGQLAVPDAADDSVEVTLPADLPGGEYGLLVFNEQLNGNKGPDAASPFSRVSLTVRSAPAVTPEPELTPAPVPAVPATGDGGNPAVWLGLALVAAMLLNIRRKAAQN